MRAKASFLRKLLPAVDVCLLQETHGSAEEAERIFNVLRRDWVWHSNVGPSRNAGGTVILVRRRLITRDDDLVTESVVAGRVSRSRMAKDGKQCIIWNVHNYELPADARRETNRRIEEDRLAAQRDPSNVSLWVGGDFNFPPPLSQ